MLGMYDAIVVMAMNYFVKKQPNIRKMKMRTRQVINVSFNLNRHSDKDCLRDFCFKRICIGVLLERCKFTDITNLNEYICDNITATCIMLMALATTVR